MQINKLVLQNYRNHTNTAIELDKMNIFLGRNNSGKTAILSAIEWALTGRNLWTDRAGRGAGELVNKGAGACQVGLELAGFGGVVRSMPPHSLTAGKNRGIQDGQAALYYHLGVDEEILKLALNAGSFAGMAPAEQQAFIFSLCGVSFSPDDIAAAVHQYLLKAGVGEETAGEAARRAGSLVPQGISCDPAILEGMARRAREMRKETKRELERIRAALAETELSSLPEGIALAEQEDVKRQLAALEANRDQLLQSLGRRQCAEQSAANARQRAAQLAEEITRLGTGQAELMAKPGGIDRAALDQQLDLSRAKLLQLDRRAAEITPQLADLNGRQQGRAMVLERLRRFDGCCPLAPGSITCSLTPDGVAELISQLERERQEAEAALAQLAAQMAWLQTRQQAEKEQSARLQEQLCGLTREEQSLAADRQVIQRLQAELEQVRQEAAEWEEAARQCADGADALARLQQRITRGREILRQLELAGHDRRQAARRQADLAGVQAEYAILDHLVKALGPGAAGQSLLGGRLAEFTARLNEQLAAFTGGRYQLTWQEDFTPAITADGHTLVLKLLSKSEQLRVGIAFQAAVAKITGLNFLAVDEVDILDQDNRDLLTGTLLEALDQFDQILLFCTVGEVNPPHPGLPGVKMFRVEAGTVSESGKAGLSQPEKLPESQPEKLLESLPEKPRPGKK